MTKQRKRKKRSAVKKKLRRMREHVEMSSRSTGLRKVLDNLRKPEEK